MGQSRPDREPGPSPSYREAVSGLAVLALALGAIGYAQWARTAPRATTLPRPAPRPSPRVVLEPPPADEPEPDPPLPPPPPGPTLDRVAVAKAEETLDAARRDRKRAERRAAEAAAALADANARSAGDALAGRTLATRVHDPSARIARANGRLVSLQSEKKQIETEIAGLAKAPRPKRKQLIDRTPVAKPTEGEEVHFEVRRNRVSFIDLDRLLELVKADARLRIRMNEGGRPITNTVGPVGAFSLRYSLARSLPASVEDLLDRNGTPSYSLRSWEVLPEYDGRGETIDMAFRPAATFARTINRLNPERATITMWIYPDGFPLYRQLRDALHHRGFLVAARPLPEGMAIRGSPAGSLSAGQ
jgi:hypothetical protein